MGPLGLSQETPLMLTLGGTGLLASAQGQVLTCTPEGLKRCPHLQMGKLRLGQGLVQPSLRSRDSQGCAPSPLALLTTERVLWVWDTRVGD